MALQEVSAGIRSGQRNGEIVLLAAALAFVAIAWRALDASPTAAPAGSSRILAQFAATAAFGHIGLRIVAPRSAGVIFATSMLLTAIGLAFAARLAPDVTATQANWASLGVLLMVAAAAATRRYPMLRRYRYTAALIAVGLLVATGLFGQTYNGARLWIVVAGQTIQTTELIKLFFIVFLAGYLADEAAVLEMPRLRFAGRSYSALPYLAPLALTVLAAIIALALLKDLGSIAILLLLSMASLYVATGRLRFVFGGLALLALTGVAGYLAFGHAQVRVDAWLDPWSSEDTTGYQTVQSLYAIQAGGVTGTGLGKGTPESIPASTTDYVFSAIAEELGLAGAVGVVMLFILLLFAGLRVAMDAPEGYGRLLAACIALLLAIQAAVIIAGNLRIIPTTGITLPFVSYGGSSLVVNYILVGMLLGISESSARRR